LRRPHDNGALRFAAVAECRRSGLSIGITNISTVRRRGWGLASCPGRDLSDSALPPGDCDDRAVAGNQVRLRRWDDDVAVSEDGSQQGVAWHGYLSQLAPGDVQVAGDRKLD